MSIRVQGMTESFPAEKRALLSEKARFRERYEVLGRVLELRADASSVLDKFKKMYGRFLAQRTEASPSVFYVVQDEEFFGCCALVDGERVHLVRDSRVFLGYAFMSLMHSFLSEMESHWIFHAAALSRGGEGILIPAYENHGKTTLALELVKRGFTFLSDEIACVERSLKRLDPFARSVGLEAGKSGLLGAVEKGTSETFLMPDGGLKEVVDIEDLYRGSVGEPCPCRFLFVLDGWGPKAGHSDRHFDVSFCGPVYGDFLSALKEVRGIKEIVVKDQRDYPTVTVRAERQATIALPIEEICKQFGVRIFYTTWGREDHIDFERQPTLARLSPVAAARALMRHFFVRPHFFLDGEASAGNLCRVFLDVVGLIQGMDCYTLSTGHLEAMADLVDGAVTTRRGAM